MCNIDEIMDLFDWNNSIETQEEGLRLARQVKSINVFLQPLDSKHNKNVWDNCAKTLSERSDEELRPYLITLLEWLIDTNWPGSLCIYDRLLAYKDKKSFDFSYNECLKTAKALKEEIWEDVLISLYQSMKF